MRKGILSVLSALAGVAIGAGTTARGMAKSTSRVRNMSDKHLALFLMMNQWVKIKQEGKNLASYFEENGYKKIAIYGMSYAGETLLDELKNSETEVLYAIDKNADKICTDVKVALIDDVLEDVDAVVVTAITFFDEIEEKLSLKFDCPIISLEDILYGI